MFVNSLLCLLSLMMMSSDCVDFETKDVTRAIECLESTLNKNYLVAEKLMSLRFPKTSELDDIFVKIDQNYVELLSAITDSGLDT